MTIWMIIQVEKSRTRIVDFDSSSDEEKEEEEEKQDNSEWREEVQYSISHLI